MFEITAFIVFLGVGLAVWRAIVFLNGLYEEHVPDKYQDRIYKTSKDLPKLAWGWLVGIVFWTSVGAVLMQIALRPFGLHRLLPAAPWAPGVVLVLLMAILFSFWDSPHRTKGPAKSRGRQISKSLDQVKTQSASSSAPTKRGRTIRSYRDIK